MRLNEAAKSKPTCWDLALLFVFSQYRSDPAGGAVKLHKTKPKVMDGDKRRRRRKEKENRAIKPSGGAAASGLYSDGSDGAVVVEVGGAWWEWRGRS